MKREGFLSTGVLFVFYTMNICLKNPTPPLTALGGSLSRLFLEVPRTAYTLKLRTLLCQFTGTCHVMETGAGGWQPWRGWSVTPTEARIDSALNAVRVPEVVQ